MTASLQPLDSGIIKSFKAQYRKLQLQKMVELADAHLPTELRLDYAVRYCKMAWNSVSPDSISNCWNHTGIIRFTSTAAVEPLNYGNLLDHDIFAITPENLMTEREFQLVDDSQEAKMKLTDDNFLVSTVTAKEELGDDDDATVTQRLPSLREARAAAETVLLFLDHSKRATSDDVNLSADFLRRAYAISEGEKTQVVITDFFKKILWKTQASPLAWRPANFQKSCATTARAAAVRKVKPFCPCFDFVSHRNGGSTNCIKFCVKNGFKGAKIFWMLQTAYGNAVMSRRRVFEWYKHFKEGREETADNDRSGRPFTSTTPEKVDKVLELVREDRRITVREFAEEAEISFGSTQSIMKDISRVRRLNAVLVPKDLSFDQKNARKETASLKATTDDSELLETKHGFTALIRKLPNRHRSGASKMSRDQRGEEGSQQSPGHVDGVLRLPGHRS
ncbi:hypothetical protein LAZ67_8002508 [Cordylochernes scorpioides]|uniref:DDE-1 domain-containing protein n=1 Tax=Cordylochernes scorpioides TaxID=51811 RepID=A0ABY6KR05_9ARAC|nr:hypothetical protein LAZ67_8002508 [Cordylochernes scorpioides]